MPLAEHDHETQQARQAQPVSIHVPLAEHDEAALVKFIVVAEVSIHVPLAEHDSFSFFLAASNLGFNSRAPRGARPACAKMFPDSGRFQFTCPSRSTTHVLGLNFLQLSVSIHVPLAEHDRRTSRAFRRPRRFNSRAPRGARRAMNTRRGNRIRFQFTCPSRSTTGSPLCGLFRKLCFNSRAPRGARHL